MEIFTKLFGNLLAFVYHCFDRIVIHGHPPFGAQVILNGHEWVERLARRSGSWRLRTATPV
jgi:hypothetical protein